MGRKNFESIVAAVGGPLPNRNNIIVTRESEYEAAGCKVASSLEEAIMYGHEDNDKEEIFIIGGGEIYRQAMDLSNYMYLTRVHAWIAGDIVFPEVDPDVWEEVEREEHTADIKHKFAFTFLTFKKKDRLHL